MPRAVSGRHARTAALGFRARRGPFSLVAGRHRSFFFAAQQPPTWTLPPSLPAPAPTPMPVARRGCDRQFRARERALPRPVVVRRLLALDEAASGDACPDHRAVCGGSCADDVALAGRGGGVGPHRTCPAAFRARSGRSAPGQRDEEWMSIARRRPWPGLAVDRTVRAQAPTVPAPHPRGARGRRRHSAPGPPDRRTVVGPTGPAVPPRLRALGGRSGSSHGSRARSQGWPDSRSFLRKASAPGIGTPSWTSTPSISASHDAIGLRSATCCVSRRMYGPARAGGAGTTAYRRPQPGQTWLIRTPSITQYQLLPPV